MATWRKLSLKLYIAGLCGSCCTPSLLFGERAILRAYILSCRHAHIIRSADGTLVGTDMFGNRYYENYDTASYSEHHLHWHGPFR